jgi:hypothetical protein
MRQTVEFLLRLPHAQEMQTFKLSLFPGARLRRAQLPTFDLPEELRLLYALLCQATRHPDLTADMIRGMADNPAYRQDPEKLAELLTVMFKDRERL